MCSHNFGINETRRAMGLGPMQNDPFNYAAGMANQSSSPPNTGMALEQVKPDKTVAFGHVHIKGSRHDVVVYKESVVVGCYPVPREFVESVYKLWHPDNTETKP
jgi:hypothetical protein